MIDQAEKLRLMVRHHERRAVVFAVTSGKGGVGKSNIAANLALCLARTDRRVLLIDADLGLANLDVLLQVRAPANLSHVINGRRQLQDIITPGPAGLRLICGASGLAQLADINDFQRQRLIQDMEYLEQQVDFIIIDTGAGISHNVVGFCRAADHVLVISTPEPTSITDAYAMIKILSREPEGVKLSLLVNMADDRTEAKKVYQRLAVVAKKFLSVVVYDAGYILRDDHFTQAVRQQQPLVLTFPHCQAALCINALAGKLGRSANADAPGMGFFRRVANWFF
ncbi:MAG: MinD/ParA family protein [Sedimentisphaerales bacterium]|nr:MinD/ParA family protein [Sedimentisphaerales bacterium]